MYLYHNNKIIMELFISIIIFLLKIKILNNLLNLIIIIIKIILILKIIKKIHY
jgi:hypothetical protein